MRVFIWRILVVIVLVFLFLSCLKKYHGFDIVSETEFIAPAAYGSFELGDIIAGINTDSLFQLDSNNELMFIYRDDSIASIKINDLIDIPANLQLVESEKEVGEIKLKPYVLREILTIFDLKDRFPQDVVINNLPDNILAPFPEIILGDTNSENLKFEIFDFDFLQYGHFVEGEMVCEVTNNFPTNCKVIYQFSDKNGKFFEEFEFGANNPTGLLNGETEVKYFSLAGKAIEAPIYYTIKSIQLFETKSPVYIQFSNNLSLNIKMSNMIIDEGIINSDNFQYITDPEYVQFDIGDTLQLTRTIFEKGRLQIRINKTFVPNGNLIINFPYLYKNGEPVNINIPINGVDSEIVNVELSGLEMSLSNEINEYNSIKYNVEFNAGSGEKLLEFKHNDSFNYKLSLEDVAFSYIEGYFGRYNIDISQNGIELGNNLLDKIGGNIVGNDPVLKLIFSNNVGIPALLNVQIDAYNQLDESVSLIAEPFLLSYPENIGAVPKLSEYEFNSSNSPIANFMRLPPSKSINFFASINLNPQGGETNRFSNFVVLNKPFNVGLEIKIPFLLEGSFFTFSDTIPFLTSSIDEFIEHAEIIFRTDNTMPLQVDLRVFPFDSISKTKTGDELYVTILEAAKVDQWGNVIIGAEAENSIFLNSDDIHSLSIANTLLVNATFMSPDNGNSPAKLKSEYGFDLKVIFNVKPKF